MLLHIRFVSDTIADGWDGGYILSKGEYTWHIIHTKRPIRSFRKKKWADANAKGEDTSPYEQSAKAYYEELRSNGRQDVADKLSASDDITASAYLKTLAPGYNSGDYNPQNAVKGIYNAKVAYDEAKATGKDTSSAENSAKAYYAELRETAIPMPPII